MRQNQKKAGTAADYKHIILPVDFYDLNANDHDKLESVFGKFPRRDIAYTIGESGCTVLLGKVNFDALKTTIAEAKKDIISDALSILLDSIVREIDAIKSYGLRAGKRVYVGYNQERKVKGRKQKEINRSQYYYAQGNGFSDENTVLPEEYENRIICGDSAEILKNLPDNCIDLVFTSPPYNFGLDYESDRDDARRWENYFNKLFGIFDECIRVLKYGGRIIVNIQPLFSDYIPSHHVISSYFMSRKMIWKGEILWEKNNYNCKYTAWGSWKSPSNPYLKYTWEFLEIFSKGTLKKQGVSKHADISADEFKKWVVSKWSIAPERNMKKFNHPAMFPQELATRVLKLFSFSNDVVLDPFNGVGTTTLCAQMTGRRYLGIDISKEYCKKAQKRVDEADMDCR